MTDDAVDTRSTSIGDSAITVEAAPQQLLCGLTVGRSAHHVVCVACGVHLGEGRAVTVYGYRCADSAVWDLQRWYCPECAPTEIDKPTLGVSELLVYAWLGSVALPRTRTHRLCLTEVERVAFSPPDAGSHP